MLLAMQCRPYPECSAGTQWWEVYIWLMSVAILAIHVFGVLWLIRAGVRDYRRKRAEGRSRFQAMRK